MKIRALPAALVAAFPCLGSAAMLDADGLGQALIYPYYSAQSAQGDPFNTYLSVVSTSSSAKAVRVRVREARNAREVISFNLFLSPNDVWTAAIVPDGDGARLVTADHSCTDPPLDALPGGLTGHPFNNFLYSGGASDGAGAGLDRTREGWVEMLEMATLTGAAATAVTHNSAGVPANCAAVQHGASPSVAAPSGGLSGTLTLIDVARGTDFAINAEAIADLATRPYYRSILDSYPDFNAAEIDPLSVVVANGSVYRSTWSRGVDAVSALFMRSEIITEYILDSVTRSNTTIAVTFPTRHFYVDRTSATAPFSVPAQWAQFCTAGAENVTLVYYNREGQAATSGFSDFPEQPPQPPPAGYCAPVAVLSMRNGAPHMFIATENTFGSASFGFRPVAATITASFQNGWLRLFQPQPRALTSLATSTRTSIATGAVVTGPHTFSGLPQTGFAVRTLENGTLSCGAINCQGNYGAAFPLKYRRSITQ